jgi:hypothetical protein
VGKFSDRWPDRLKGERYSLSHELKDLGVAQVVVRVLCACAATAILGVGAFTALGWLFGN